MAAEILEGRSFETETQITHTHTHTHTYTYVYTYIYIHTHTLMNYFLTCPVLTWHFISKLPWFNKKIK